MTDTLVTRLPRLSRMDGPPAAVARWIIGWIIVGLAAPLVVIGVLDPSTVGVEGAGGPAALVVLIGLGVAAQLAAVEVNRSQSSHIVSLLEVAIVTTFLLADGYWGWVIAVTAVALAQVLQPKAWFKRLFNIAQASVAGAVAALTYSLLTPAASTIGWTHVGAVTLATLLFGVTNWLAVMGVLTRLEGRSVWSRSPQTRTLSSFSTLGNISIGVVTAVLWRSRPDMAIFAAVPLLSVYAAYRGIAATRASLEREHAHAQRLARVLDAAEEGVVVLDELGRVEMWSPAIARLTGITADDAISASLDDLLQPLDEAGGQLRSPLPTVGAAGSTIDWRLADVDGRMHDLSVSVAPLVQDDERVGTVVLLRDMTRQREVERLKDDFLMRVSHELRTPLTPIRGFAENLRTYRDRLSPEQVDVAVGTIIARADDLSRMVDDLLLVAAPGGSHSNLPRAVQVDGLMDAVVAGAVRSHPGRTVEVTIEDLDAGLFSQDSSAPVMDVSGVTRILEILLDNALRYSEAETTVNVVATTSGGWVDFTVLDRGRGIPSDHLETVFDRFHRVEDPMLMTTRGVGVGLYIARRLARLAGGDITVESRLGRGSTFTLRVPDAGTDARQALVPVTTAVRQPAA